MKKKILILTLFCMALFTSSTTFAWSEVFTDDFSSGDLSKWTASGFSYDTASGGMKIPHWTNNGAFPNNVNASKNIAIEFDYKEVENNTELLVRFNGADDSFFKVRLKDNAIEVYNGDSKVETLSVSLDMTNLNRAKVELLDGTLKVYTKTSGAEDYVPLISKELDFVSDKEYLPGFWALTANDKIVDNVVITTLPALEPEFSAETIDAQLGSTITVSFDNPPTGTVNDDNIWLEKGDGTKVSAISKISEGVYELTTNVVLSEGETVKVKISNLTDGFGQQITSFEKNIQVNTSSTPSTAPAWPEVFTDDFSSGDLSKWTATDAFSYDAESGGMKIPHWTNNGAFPNSVNASKNIAIEFDYKEVVNNTEFLVRFKSVDDSYFQVRLKNNTIEVNDGSATTSIWSGTLDMTNLNCAKIELLDGTLNVYTKTSGAENYEHLVSTELDFASDKEYLPGFWALTGNEKIVDNVVIRMLPLFEAKFSSETIDARPESKITISFDNPPTGTVNDDNIWLEKGDGTKISLVSKISEGVYELITNVWLSENEMIKLKIANIENTFGQQITSFEKDIKVLTYTNDFTLQVMNADGDERIPITELEQGNQTIAVTLLPNRQTATAADIAIILCKGTEEKYSVSDIYYYNAVSVNGEKSAAITVGTGEFLKVMTFTDFITGKIAGKTVSIMQAE